VERLLRKKLPHGKFVGVSKERSERMRAVKGRGNRTTEIRLRSALVRFRLRGWRIASKEIPGRPDFYFPKRRLAVFVDGCFWHGCRRCGHYPKTNSKFWRAKIERNRVRDRKTAEVLQGLGVKVIRFWEHELRDELARCVERIELAFRRRKG
jgi:DNA mismatch endonuclease (patch repair protein)